MQGAGVSTKFYKCILFFSSFYLSAIEASYPKVSFIINCHTIWESSHIFCLKTENGSSISWKNAL